MTVTFRATAETPEGGTPPRPVTCTSTVAPDPTGPEMPPVPLRVSRMRTGVRGVYRPEPDAVTTDTSFGSLHGWWQPD